MSNPAGYFIIDRSPPISDLLRRDAVTTLRTEQHNFIARMGSRNRVKLDHNLVHCHPPYNRDLTPSNQDLIAWNTPEAIRIANRYGANALFTRGNVFVTIADAPA